MADTAAPTRYSIAVPNPESHLVEVTMTIDMRHRDASEHAAQLDGVLEIGMAAWCPGSYLVRDYARFVRDVRAAGADGRPLAIAKFSKHGWAIECDGQDIVTVNYEVYGFDLTVRTNHIDDTHAFLHGPATFLYAKALTNQPADVDITLPLSREWTIATGLEKKGECQFVAADLDTLLDCPLHLGVVENRHFEAADARFELAVWGHCAKGIHDLDDLVRDLTPILEAHAARFGGLPFDEYTFMLMLSPKAYGGLEHKNSSANLASSYAFAKENSYCELLELLSHEFFHVWNGKRIFPASFEPFDYERENYTRCLWVMEGLTSYYDRYTTLRSGPLTTKRYLEKLAEEWGRLTNTPGRHRHSLESSSFDAWIKLYKPDPSNLNTTVSYYLKGGLVSTTLDLWVRRQTDGERSLDNVLDALWQGFGVHGRGYPEDVQSIFSEALGLDVSEPFRRWIVGTEDPDLVGELSHVGLMLSGASENGAESVYLGVQTGERPLRANAVLDDSPAARAGLSPGDELVALEGYRISSAADLRNRLAPMRPGDRTQVVVFRRDKLLELSVELAPSPPRRVQISTLPEASETQKAGFSSWLGEDWPKEALCVGTTSKRWT